MNSMSLRAKRSNPQVSCHCEGQSNFPIKGIASSQSLLAMTAFCCLVLLFFSASAKDKIQKGFERLAVYDYFKAREYFFECIKKQPVPAYYGLSIICCRNDNPFFNLDSARIYILISDSLFNYLGEKKVAELKKKYNIGSQEIFARKDSVALTAFQIAAKDNDIRKWNDFLEKYSFSRLL